MATQTRLPTGDSSVDNGWSSSSGTTKAADVDDPVGSNDGDTTYAFKNGANANQLHTFDPFTIPTGSTGITISVVYFGRRTSTSLTINPRLRVSGTTYEGSGAVPGSSYASRQVDWATNPATSAAWTVSEANATLEAGYANTQTTSGEEARVTQCYLLATYTPPTVPVLLVGEGEY
jgi:hypothetical protein